MLSQARNRSMKNMFQGKRQDIEADGDVEIFLFNQIARTLLNSNAASLPTFSSGNYTNANENKNEKTFLQMQIQIQVQIQIARTLFLHLLSSTAACSPKFVLRQLYKYECKHKHK